MNLRRALVPLAAVLLLLGACSEEIPPPSAKPALPAAAALTTYQPELEPAAAVLPLVPAEATSLRVTDFDEVRRLLGQESLTSASPQADRDAFWAQAAAEAPLLSPGRLRPVEAQVSAFGFTQDDVGWEAEFGGARGSGDPSGWVLEFRVGLDMAAVQSAVDAGIGPLAGATVLPEQHLAVVGTAGDPAQSWGASGDLVSLVGARAGSTYLQRGCVTDDQALALLPAGAELEDLDGFAVGFEGLVATARLTGRLRTDLFTRMRLSLDDTASGFPEVFTDGVADPSTGRIGYTLLDPAAAVSLARAGTLPFAACAPS